MSLDFNYGIVAAILSWLVVGLLVKKAPQLGLVDRPNERSSHTKITPRGGGIGIVLAWLIGCIAWWNFAGKALIDSWGISIYLFASLLVAGVSLRDDFRSVGAGMRFGVHLIAALAVVLSFGYFKTFHLGCSLHLGWVGLLVTVFWIVGLTNVFNFMDGIDGIAGTQGMIAGLAWTIGGIGVGLPAISVMGAISAGVCIGFLIKNWHPAKIFMGDVGSAFLGFVFGVMPVLALAQRSPALDPTVKTKLPVFAVLVVWPFVADGTFTFCRRLIKRERVWEAHRSHLYQRMVQAGWSHAAVTIYYGFWAVFCAIAAALYLMGEFEISVWVVPALFSISTWYLTISLERRKCTSSGVPIPGL